MGTVSNIHAGIKIGSGAVKLGAYGAAEGACADIGYTKGGVELKVDRKYLEIDCDNEIGVLNVIKTAERATLKIPMAEATLDNLARALDYDPATYVAASVGEFGGLATARALTLFINVDLANGGTRKLEIYKCYAIAGGAHKYEKDKETVYDVEFLLVQDTTKTANKQLFKWTDAGVDTTPPTIAMTTPAAGGAGTVTKVTKNTVILTITETNVINQNTIVYGDTVKIINVTVPATPTLVAGTIVYDATAKTITFTPTANWTASDKLVVEVSTGLADNAGNHLAAAYVDAFSVTA